MAGVKGRSGHRTTASILKKCNKLIENSSEDILKAYIEKAIKGDSACLIDLANRLMGKSKDMLDISVAGQLSADQVAMIYKAAYEQFQAQEVKQLTSSDTRE